MSYRLILKIQCTIILLDIQAGKNAGIKTIGVKWSPKGYQHLLELEPDLMIDEMKEIIPYIEGAC